MKIYDLEFVSLSLRNFQSYGNNLTVIPLNTSVSTLVTGENLDNTTHGTSSNGTGKSTWLNALVYAVYGKPLNDVKLDELVNNINQSNMEATVEFIRKNVNYKIKRERKSKDGNNVKIFIDDEDKTQAGKIDQQILEIIGIPYELFVRIVIFSDLLDSFLDLKTADQSAFMEELFGITILSEKAENLKLFIKSNEQELKLQQVKIEQQELAVEKHNEQLVNTQRRIDEWCINNERQIESIRVKVQDAEKSYATAVLKADQDLKILDQELASLPQIDFEDLKNKRSELDELVEVQQDLNTKIREISQEIARSNKNITTTEASIHTIESEIVELTANTCPYCKQDYAKTKDKIASKQQELDILRTNLQVLIDAIDANSKLLEQRQNELNTIFQRIADIGDIPSLKHILEQETKPDSIKKSIQQINEKINELKSDSNPYIELIESNEQQLNDLKNAVNPYTEVLDELNNESLVQIDYSKINELTIEIDHQKFLLKLLTKKDSFIRKNILNKNIPYLNKRLSLYLTQLNLPHKIEFMQDLSVKISLLGRSISFGALSSGQRARVKIALSIAFRDVLQFIHSSINLWILDEVLDLNLDSNGVVDAARLIKQRAREDNISLFVISHREEMQNIFESTMKIQMQKGFSYVIS